MPAVRDLHCLGRSNRGAFAKDGARSRHTTSIPGLLASQAATLDASGPAAGPPAVRLDVDQHRAVAAALARRVLIDADHPRGR
ncbi:hypothetical protein ACFV2U_24540 [Streptomyces sp. NPDC059697]|uniref:hypothetical protein n=1 Tax=Streptomyces sp. NPDC059697 TaxID=3346912 RepID=UPI00369A46B8